jgi:hypothetical protein
MTLRAIAERLGVSHECIRKDLGVVIGELQAESREAAREMVTMESERIDLARFAIYPRVVAGDLEAIDRWFRLGASYCRLHGLNKPASVAPGSPASEPTYQPLDQERIKALRKLPKEMLEQLMKIIDVLEGRSTPDAEEFKSAR